MDVLSLFRLDGEVAVVTGAGTGIGRGIALGLASAGADVVVAGRRPEMIDAVAAEIRATGRRSLAVPTDVMDDDQLQHLIDRTVAEFGKLDIWVNNAGGLQGERPTVLRMHSRESFQHILDLNYVAPWAAIARAQASMAPGGRIINVSSIAALRNGTPTNGPYGAAKAALNHMTKTYALELSRRKIRVNAIAPGPVDTPDMRGSMRIGDEQVAAMGEGVTLGRLGTDEDFAAAAVYLASKASDWVTGQVLVVSGGP
ncbi:MAG: SDR family NAD(P)-dependent oxidoreductase [Dehalococcoidia bacterium]